MERQHLARFELLGNALPSKEVAHHPTSTYVAMETDQTPPAVGIWEVTTGSLVWADAGALALAWTHDGEQLLVIREERRASQPDDMQDAYVFERRLWPRDSLESSCLLQLPYSAWPYDLWVASTDTLAIVHWMDQGASGWEVMLIQRFGDVHLVGAGFEVASEVGIEGQPTVSPNRRFAVSGYQSVYKTLPEGAQVLMQRGRFEAGRIVVIDILAGTYRDIVVDDAVPAKLHGTAARRVDAPQFLDRERFEVMLPTGAKRIYSVHDARLVGTARK